MKEIILLKNGEIALKGQNRRTFEDVLMKNVRHAISGCGNFSVKTAQSAIYVEPTDDAARLDDAVEKLKKVFGIAAMTRACVTDKDIDSIKAAAAEYLKPQLSRASTFKVEAKRSDKSFPMKSPQICAELGGYLLEKYGNLRVNVSQPDLEVTVEIRDFGAYIHAPQTAGAGGMPVGTGGKAAILISGGIDSPVAAYMIAKRGVRLTAVHFASPPYTGERAELKVRDLMKKVSEYAGVVKLFVVPFTEIQEQIGKKCPEELFTVIMRRFMMRISERIAANEGASALVTGESLGQVASQTMQAMVCTEAVCHMPVFRPLIGMDKGEIVEISKKIDTFDISVLPYEDCCTVFTPRHPRTRPKLDMLERAESGLDCEALVDKAVNGARVLYIDAAGQ